MSPMQSQPPSLAAVAVAVLTVVVVVVERTNTKEASSGVANFRSARRDSPLKMRESDAASTATVALQRRQRPRRRRPR